MPGIGLGIGVGRGGSRSWITQLTPQFKAVYDNMTNQPTEQLALIYNTFVKSLVDGEVWDEIEYLNIKTTPVNDNGEAQINWITPTTKNTIGGTLTFNAFSGFKGSANGYIATGITPSTSAKFLQDDACYFFYKKTIGANLKSDGGCVGANTHIVNGATHSVGNGLTYSRVNNKNTSADVVAPAAYTGLWLLNRTSSAAFAIWQGKTKLVTKNIASTGRPDREFYEFVANDASLSGFSDAEFSINGLGGSLSDAKIAILSDAIDALFVSLNAAIQYDATKWGNSVVLADYTTHVARSAFSEYTFTYSGTKLYVKANPTIYAVFPSLSYLTIYVNGVLNQRVTYATHTEKEITLPAGNKTVKIVSAINTMPVATFLGVYPTIIRGFSTITPIAPVNVSDKIVFIGDSIISGSVSTYPEVEGCASLFRVENGKDIAFHSWGYATLSYMAADAGKIAATVTHIQNLLLNATGTKKIICNLGTNDHQILSLSAANFETYYGNLLDAIHTADEDIEIWCVSPIIRNDAYENATLDNYRTSVGTVCAARSTYATHIAGKAILTTADLGDAVHPSTAGHKKLKDAIYAVVYP